MNSPFRAALALMAMAAFTLACMSLQYLAPVFRSIPTEMLGGVAAAAGIALFVMAGFLVMAGAIVLALPRDMTCR